MFSIMGLLDRLRAPKGNDAQQAPTGGAGPAAAAGKDSRAPVGAPGEPSEAGSSFDNAQTAVGGADAVPDTPDAVAEDYT